ncbi:hypothetical protein HID58_008867, partial [Brassica napus]
ISGSVNGVVFPVTRDLSTGQYVAEIRLGDSYEPVNLVVDLSGTLLWFDCSSGHISTSRSLISGSSSGCLKAKAGNDRVSSRGDQNGDCDLLVRNGVVGITARGELATDWSPRSNGPFQGPNLSPFTTRRGNQRTPSFNCLSLASNGVVSTRSVEDVFGAAAARSLVYTPLSTASSGGYLINVKSIRVNGFMLAVNGTLSAELSTLVPYTTMESSLYAVFADAYVKAAASNAKLVAPVAPFGLCFTSTSSSDFPAVDLALQSEMVRWRIQGDNLLVDVGGGVRCLGIVDGGSNRVSPIIMGGLQLEGFVLDFDLGNSVMGFGERTRSSLDSFRQQAL